MTQEELDSITRAATKFVEQVPTENNEVFLQGVEFALSAVRIAQLADEMGKGTTSTETCRGPLKRGERIKIYKPLDLDEGPGWDSLLMDEFVSRAQTFKSYTPQGNIRIIGTSFLFDPKWVVAEGDWVVVNKPSKVISLQGIYWPDELDKFDGQLLQVTEIDERGAFYTNSWFFDLEWCTKMRK